MESRQSGASCVNNPAAPEGKSTGSHSSSVPETSGLPLLLCRTVQGTVSFLLWGHPRLSQNSLQRAYLWSLGVQKTQPRNWFPAHGGCQPSCSPPQVIASDPRDQPQEFSSGGWVGCEWTAFQAESGGWEWGPGGRPLLPCRSVRPADGGAWHPDGIISEIITNISECLLSAQFSSLETGPTHPWAALRKGLEPASCPGVTFQVRPGGALPKPTPG